MMTSATQVGTVALALLCGTAVAGETAGADLVCSQINSVTSYASVDGYRAFSFGDVTCNFGDTPIVYNASTSEHPVFASTLYRFMDGRIEQIGVGFAGHTFFALQGNSCGIGCVTADLGSLGAGCSDTIGSALSGSQGDLAPRSEIDPYSADLPYPFTTFGVSGNPIYKRVKTPADSLAESGAIYFVERQYISAAETTDAARNNNASYRRLDVNQSNGGVNLAGPTMQQRAAIYAWADHGLGVNTPDPSVMISEIQIPSDGVLHLGSKVTDLGNGTYRYDYAVHNQNSVLGVGSIRIPVQGSAPTSLGFNGIEYLDAPDNAISSTAWTTRFGSGFMTWETEDFESNINANAIRWGTMYNFSLVSDRGPVTAEVELGMFQTGGVKSVIGLAVTPGEVACGADLTGDGNLNFLDVSAFLSSFAAMDPAVDFEFDGQYNFLDVSAFLSLFAAGCP